MTETLSLSDVIELVGLMVGILQLRQGRKIVVNASRADSLNLA